jgi:uncharacterized membrane protein YuzA (DUF378 family)
MTVIMREKGCMASTIGYYLVIIGAINWGLVGVGGLIGHDWNVVHMIFGMITWLEAAVYILVGIAGVMTFVGCKCETCKSCHVDAVKEIQK